MNHHPNETPEPLAGPSVESCATALAEALRREKGWLLDYGHSVIRDAIDRTHLEPLAQEQAGEMPEPWQCFQHNSGWNTWENVVPSARYEAGVVAAYTAQQMRDYRTAALQAKDAEIAGLKAELRDREAHLFEARKLLDERPAINAGLFEAYSKWTGKVYSLDWLNAVDAAAIRAQTGGAG